MLTSPPVFTLLCLLSMVQAEVVLNFKECPEYFYKERVPALGVAAGTHICQRYNNRYHFATLYDTQRRIPVYSAYIFQPGNGLGRPSTWFVEPQLVCCHWSPEMKYESQCPVKNKALLGKNQALDEDYDNLHREIHRGHLNPYSHNIGESAIATFTLTNAVPQVGQINSGVWRVHEGKLYTLFETCSKAYAVVGAIPSLNNWINVDRVNVPDYLWNAYCCVDNNGKPIRSGAAWVENKKGVNVVESSLDQLVQFLKSHKFPAVGDIFDKNCK